ncbi:hypothetical protein CALVIDRAFT_548511 [Calocera viscosa TUFC12733]|uniref:UBA domain-containing protein n=1 Tax=Calocera viscosa (strain TUFC12733) TaxID=1330018 RepID=A0A167QVE2_CALVF|nr:hypothetical protein CALVIDRAFT_548511 [Calocera viscosa TUFC12733]
MDAFEDLWKSAAPTSAQQQAAKSQSLNAAAAQAATARSAYNKADSFSLLSSAPGSRTLTPSLPLHRPTSAASSTRPPSAPRNGDAFSTLMSFGGSAAASSQLSLADRQAKIEQERKERERKQHEEHKAQGAFWDRFGGDDLLAPSPAPAASTSRTSTPALEPMRPSPIPEPATNPAPSASNGFDLLDFDSLGGPSSSAPASKPASVRVSPAAAAILDPFDFDALDRPVSGSGSLSAPKGPSPRSTTPGSFDFGDREDNRWLDNDDDDEDDILGALSRPVTEQPRPEPAETLPEPRQAQPTASPAGPRSRAVSPPPHVIGQIVEMGFSPQQARFALATTESGLDVQAALDTLLAQSAAMEPEEPNTPDASASPRVLHIVHNDDEEAVEVAERRRRRRQGPTRQNMDSRNAASPHSRGDGYETPKLQEQADRLISQATDFGLNMFSRANALLKQGREQVQKAYEERARAQAAANGAGRGRTESGRPKWMVDEGHFEEPNSPTTPVHHHGSGFRDDDDVTHGQRPAESSRPRQQQLDIRQDRRREPTQPRPQETRQPARELNLFGDEPVGYVSPARRRRPADTNAASPARSPAPQAAPTPPPPKPKPKPARPSVAVTPAARSASDTHKAKGTEFFKLGQFAEAETSYTNALDVLPEGCGYRILLYNNRAAARLKTGNSPGVVEDCTVVLAILSLDGSDYKPDAEEEWDGVKLGDALVKALSRRAEAWEMREKWDKAAEDWQRVVTLGTWIGKAKWDIANRGLERSKRLKTGQDQAAAAPPPRPKPKPKPPVISAPAKPSEAVTRLQEANQQQDEEENLKAELKDTVEARLLAWKAGKETNIRALLASLENVLWEELQWKKVNLGELVTPAQVKARYVRAIARLHPDKLSAAKVTVEHRMIANGVFGALNEAWTAFQQQG